MSLEQENAALKAEVARLTNIERHRAKAFDLVLGPLGKDFAALAGELDEASTNPIPVESAVAFAGRVRSLANRATTLAATSYEGVMDSVKEPKPGVVPAQLPILEPVKPEHVTVTEGEVVVAEPEPAVIEPTSAAGEQEKAAQSS